MIVLHHHLPACQGAWKMNHLLHHQSHWKRNKIRMWDTRRKSSTHDWEPSAASAPPCSWAALEENAHELDGLKKRLGRNLVKEKCRRDGTEKPIAPQKKKNHLCQRENASEMDRTGEQNYYIHAEANSSWCVDEELCELVKPVILAFISNAYENPNTHMQQHHPSSSSSSPFKLC